YIEANATIESQVRSMMNAVDQFFGRLDGCYHNVYTNKVGLIREQSLEDWEDNLRGTLTSAFLVCKYAADLMRQSGGGSIVNTSSILGGAYPRPGNAGYGAGKAGLE